MEAKQPKTSADRLRLFANVNKLATLDYHTRKRLALDITWVLREREAYRAYFWAAIVIMALTVGFASYGFFARG